MPHMVHHHRTVWPSADLAVSVIFSEDFARKPPPFRRDIERVDIPSGDQSEQPIQKFLIHGKTKRASRHRQHHAAVWRRLLRLGWQDFQLFHRYSPAPATVEIQVADHRFRPWLQQDFPASRTPDRSPLRNDLGATSRVFPCDCLHYTTSASIWQSFFKSFDFSFPPVQKIEATTELKRKPRGSLFCFPRFLTA